LNAAPTNRDRAAPQNHARCSGVGAAQMQLVRRARDGAEAEREGERLGANQVRLLELQPGDVVHLDHRIAGSPRMFPGSSALLAVQVVVGADGVAHSNSFFVTDEIVTYDGTISQHFLTKSSKLTISAMVSP